MRIRWREGTLEREAIELAIRTRKVRAAWDDSYRAVITTLEIAADAAEDFLERWSP